MSALQLPPNPTATDASARADESHGQSVQRRHLRLVEPPAAPGRSLAPSGPLQAWRRRLGVLLVLGALVALLVAAAGDVSATDPAAAPGVTGGATTVVVTPGETLWQIATEHAPAGVATGAYVDQLIAHNQLDGGAVDAWQVLQLPR